MNDVAAHVRTTRVKFCGMTRREDAVAAADLGVDAIGFVFWPKSPRSVGLAEARDMTRALPPWVWRVGVFVDASIDEMRATVAAVGLDVVQLHGDESPAIAAQLDTRVMKALSRRETDPSVAAQGWDERVLLLVDAIDPVRRGGTGELADWEGARRLAATRPIVLAGGLTPDNVARGVGFVRPYGVDVSSGIEARPGVKDLRRMRAFVDAVRRMQETDDDHV
jgi:phosphoribosylanthranilate isomerase